MTRIAFIGAGSVVFTKNLLGDILALPALGDAEIALHDIDPTGSRRRRRWRRWVARRAARRRGSPRTTTGGPRSTAPTS